MPGASGLDLQSKIRHREFNLPVIFVTGGGDTESSVRAMKKGAADFLTKPVDGEQLLRTIEIAARKSKVAIEQERIVLMARSLVEKLTPRETEIMGHVVKGLRNKQIAGELGISEKTVKAHRGSVMRKVGARTLADLIHISKTAALSPAVVDDE
jgi:FixJ family two-component response regulator